MRAKETQGDLWCATQEGNSTSRVLLAGGSAVLIQTSLYEMDQGRDGKALTTTQIVLHNSYS